MSAKILIVDDEPDILLILHSILSESDGDYEITSASSGEEALQVFRRESFDLVVTDMKMPRMDGLELLQRIRELDESTEVIILTGFATIENAIAALKEDGAFDYLTKPLDSPEVLELTVNRALERRRLQRENRWLFEQVKRAKEQLSRTVQEQELLLDSVETLIWHLTDRETFGAVNEATAEFFGKTKENLTGTKLTESLGDTAAEVFAAGNTVVFKQKVKLRSDEWLQDAHGDHHLLSITRTPKLDPAGDVEYVVCSAHDITARKRTEEALRRSEARYRAIVEDQTELICRFKPDGTLSFVNEAYCRSFGKTPDEWIGQSYLSVISQEDREIVLQHNSSLDPANSTATYEHRVFDSDGEIRWQEWTARGLFEDGTRLVEIQAVGRDITERKRMQQELIKAQKLESLGVLAGGIAHDFNNLLAMMLGYISLAQLDVPDANPANARLAELEKAVDRARDLTKELLTFSEGGVPAKQRTHLSVTIREAVELTLRASRIQVSFHMPPDLWPVDCDPAQIGQVVANLTANARDAMPDGGTLAVYAENVTLPGQPADSTKNLKYVRISIKDQGSGISEEHLPKIFDPFFSTKERGAQKGMGLGLATVYSIVNKHGGYISVDSKIGFGTIFHVYLPISQGDQSAVPVH